MSSSNFDENRVKHLEFVQLIIARMASNSFILKGWTVTLSAALFALAGSNTKPVLVFIALLPALSFWGLDAYYLRQERLFRKLYEDIRNPINNTSNVEIFSISTEKYESNVSTLFKVLFSPTILAFHGSVVGTIIIILLFTILKF